MKPPKGPVRQMMGGASEFYGIWKFAKNKEAAIEFLKYYADNWPEAFKASEGYNNPMLRQPRAEADADPVGRSDLDAARQAGGPAGPRTSGPPSPAIPGRPGLPPTKSTTTSSSAT